LNGSTGIISLTPLSRFLFQKQESMVTFDLDWPVPIIDLQLCNGCGKCVEACPAKALKMKDGKATVSAPQDCGYFGICESVCPVQAISRPYLIVA
jgi:NAD-dependent dihydropyrimidine dehydrogenase PreA subunit